MGSGLEVEEARSLGPALWEEPATWTGRALICAGLQMSVAENEIVGRIEHI